MKRIFLCTVVLCLITLTCYAENLKYIGLKEGAHHYVRTDNMKIVNVFNKDNPTDFKTIGVYYEEVYLFNFISNGCFCRIFTKYF